MEKIKLFDRDEKNFLSRGLGVLVDASDAVITEVINGVYDMSFFYPLKGRLYESIIPERIVYSKGPKNHQAFRIDSIEKNDMLSGITVHAMHISYDLAGNFVEDTFIQNRNGDGAIKQLLSKALVPHNFVGTSNIQKTFNSRIVRENLLSVLLGDDDNSFLSRAGGQLERDNFRINWLSSLGEDRGVKIKYRKNLTGLNFLEDYSGVVTKVMPQGFDGLFLPEKYVNSPKSANYAIARVKNARFDGIKSKKLSSDEDDAIEHEEAIKLLRKTAKEYIEAVDTPTITADVDFVDLSQTEEYKHYKQLESVYIGDTVTIIHEPLGVEFMKQVTSYRYDPIEERYIMLTLGEDVKTLNNAINQSKKAIKKIENLENELGTSILEKYKKVATDLINSGFGGYTRYYKDRMIVMDTDDEATATKVWQFNRNGIGYSKTGIQGPYVYAWTIDGVFNTDFIGVNSITVNQLASDVGQSLDISSNESITTTVKKDDYDNDMEIINNNYSTLKQTTEEFEFKFVTQNDFDDEQKVNNERQETLEKYIRFIDGKILLGEEGNELELKLENKKIVFLDKGKEVAYFTNNQLFVDDIQVVTRMQIAQSEFRMITDNIAGIGVIK
ncbi:MAG: phage tail spike protein [Tissierellia bacterium]|nr:phage tail spike protein [Tissierellia bacterium]